MNNITNFKMDFIGAGITKSATSWIATCLNEHPQICLSNIKETHFFSHNYDRGIEWYKECFKNCPKDSVKGEYSPEYLVFEESAERIKGLFPDIKIIICLRNPIDRIISHFIYNRERGKDKYSTLEEKIEKDPGNLIKRGYYFKLIKNYLNHFPKKNILILIYEDIQKNPKGFMQKIYKFLEVNDSFIPPSATKYINQTYNNSLKYPIINRSLFQIRKIIKKNTNSDIIINILKFLGINYIANKIFKINMKKNPKQLKRDIASEATKKKLYNYYKNDISELEKLINRDLSHWKKE